MAFIHSQRHEGWRVLDAHYDDGGYSGATLDRPALQRLLTDLAAGKLDAVVVYKVDRLTRALADFAKIVEAFDARGNHEELTVGLERAAPHVWVCRRCSAHCCHPARIVILLTRSAERLKAPRLPSWETVISV